MFIYNLLNGMGEQQNLSLPMMLRVDNTGAIYLANNHSTSPRTKHIDIRTHYVRELIDQGIIKALFIKSNANDADILTKIVMKICFINMQARMLMLHMKMVKMLI